MIIVGRLTKDAVVNQLKDERKVVNFTVAVNDYYKPKDKEVGVKTVNYFNCSYCVSASIAERLKKGALVELFGRIGVNTYSNMQGEAKASLTFHVNNIKIHQSFKNENDESEAQTTNGKKEVEEVADDLPF